MARYCFSLLLLTGIVLADQLQSVKQTRTIPADVLRDFPGVCFGSTQCQTFLVGEEWDLSPFCGRSKCGKDSNGRLVEIVSDCSPPPNPQLNCTVSSETKSNAAYPECCPVYDCN